MVFPSGFGAWSAGTVQGDLIDSSVQHDVRMVMKAVQQAGSQVVCNFLILQKILHILRSPERTRQ
jgi:hypothetical protein